VLDRTVATAVTIENDAWTAPRMRLRAYDSFARRWQERDIEGACLREGLPLRLDRRGFCVLELGY
jgi:hypothetical protein